MQRRGQWTPLVYYYLATVVGLTLTLIGVIGGLRGLIGAAFPEAGAGHVYYEAPPMREPNGMGKEPRAVPDFEQQRRRAIDGARMRGYERALEGGVMALVGAPVFFWHLTQARRREPEWLGPAKEPDSIG